MATAVRQGLEEEFLSAIRKGQGTALGALTPLAGAVRTMPVVPAAARQGRAEGRSRLAAKAPRPRAGPLPGSGGNPQFPVLPPSVVRD